MNTVRLIIKLSRPRFWMYLAGPFLFGYTVVYDHQHTFLTVSFIYTFFFFLIPANILLYGINDLYDKETDTLNPKKKHEEEAVKASTYKTYQYAVMISLFAAIPIFYFQGKLSNILLLLFLVLSYMYSAPPIRFKIRPFFDSASNILYAIPAFIGFAHLSQNLPSITVIFIAWLWTFSMHLFSAIPDIEYDKTAGMQTTAVYLGKQKCIWLCIILWSLMAILSSSISPLLIIAFIYPLAVLLVISKKMTVESLYWKFPYINTILGFLLYLYAYNS